MMFEYLHKHSCTWVKTTFNPSRRVCVCVLLCVNSLNSLWAPEAAEDKLLHQWSTAAVCRRCVFMCLLVTLHLTGKEELTKNAPFLFVCMWCVCTKGSVHVLVFKSCVCVCVTHSSVVSLGMPLGRECSPLLLHRTTPSEHVQTSGQPDAGRQPLSSAPGRRGGERGRVGY